MEIYLENCQCYINCDFFLAVEVIRLCISRFVCEGTVEEKIVQLQTRKKGLAQQVLSGKGETSKLTLADLKTLFGI